MHRPGVIPGHQAVGRVTRLGPEVEDVAIGDLVGVAWLRRTCGTCEWCRSGSENLCPRSEYTGWDADGGFAEVLAAPAAFVYHLAADADPVATAPLLCAGIIGFRALSRANLPPGGRLGLYGFGSSAHLVAQIAIASGARVSVMTRGGQNRALARELGAGFVGEEATPPPQPLDSAIVFAPAGGLVPVALGATRSGGTVVLAGIEMSDIPSMSYDASLFRERDLRTVTANTRDDGRRLLDVAGESRIAPDRHNGAVRSTGLGDRRHPGRPRTRVAGAPGRGSGRAMTLDPRDLLPHRRHPVARRWRDRGTGG